MFKVIFSYLLEQALLLYHNKTTEILSLLGN